MNSAELIDGLDPVQDADPLVAEIDGPLDGIDRLRLFEHDPETFPFAPDDATDAISKIDELIALLRTQPERIAALTADCAKYRDYAAEKANQVAELQKAIRKATDPEYLTEALTKVGAIDAEWQDRAETAEARLADALAALDEAEACMSIVEPRSDKAEYLRILGVIRATLSRLTAAEKKGGDHAGQD